MFVLVNLKAYRCEPAAVAEAAAAIDADVGLSVAVAAQPSDLPTVAEAGARPWAQHVSPHGAGSHTGSVAAHRVAAAGATGTLLNHSERRLSVAAIDEAIAVADEAGLATCVCANTPAQVAAVTALAPDAVAIEPPALIGTGTPVSQADPDVVLDAVDAARTVDPAVEVYCGAGISTADDIAAAADLGADGVLLASAVATAGDPARALGDLVAPLVTE
ncbi:MAG: triose-phosphate isomerase [Halobacteriales archaeon]